MKDRVVNGVDRRVKRRANVLGINVGPASVLDAIATIEDCIKMQRRIYVCVTGAHGIMECRRNARLRAIHNAAGMVTPDGMPIVWFLRLTGWSKAERVYGPDLMRAIMAMSADCGYRHYFYGGAEGVAERLRTRLVEAHPELLVVGTYCPPFRSLTAEEDRVVVASVNATRPDIVWVGLSTPKQELWMADHLGRIDAPVMIGVGAAFDFLSGLKRQAPHWMQRSGLEWLYRLYTEPVRLWRRYAYIVPGFLFLMIHELAARPLRRLRTVREYRRG